MGISPVYLLTHSFLFYQERAIILIECSSNYKSSTPAEPRLERRLRLLLIKCVKAAGRLPDRGQRQRGVQTSPSGQTEPVLFIKLLEFELRLYSSDFLRETHV